jgi:glycosyltransferase involved in cell wall biosynthesis
MGKAHYSYRLVAERFANAFREQGYGPVLVDMPEKYKQVDDISANFGSCSETPIHISFRSTENIRPMPAARNVCYFAWEFDVLKDRELVSGPITANQKHMLSLVDEIWVSCSYTRETLLRYGLEHTHVVPTPICGITLPERQSREAALRLIASLAAIPLLLSSGVSREVNADMVSGQINALGEHPCVQARLGGMGRIFLTVSNPGDLRKNLLNAIDGFLLATDERKTDLLIVKLVVPTDEGFMQAALFEHLLPRFNGPVALYHPRVVFLPEYLDGQQMSALYSLADFYVSASHCEGFNLPLLEAMSYGTFPVSTRNTAMADYIDAQTAIIIDERVFPGLVPGMASDVSGLSSHVSVASRFDVAAAVEKALDVPAHAYDATVARGRSLVLERYSEPAVMRHVQHRLSAMLAGQGRTSLAS